MLTGELKNKVDSLWEIFWTGGLTNPLDVIEQMTYLMFIHDLDTTDNLRAKESAMLGLPYESRFAGKVQIGDREIDGQQLKWSVFHDYDAGKMYTVVQEWVPFPRMKLSDVYQELEDRYDYFVDDIEKGDLTTEAEKLVYKLAEEKFGSEFMFITDYNIKKRPFYHMRKDGVPQGYDLIWRGVEITTGAQREHRYDILKEQAEEKGLKKDVEFYLEFFRYGCPPHGGFGIGLDRIIMLLLDLPSIKEAMFLFRGPSRLMP